MEKEDFVEELKDTLKVPLVTTEFDKEMHSKFKDYKKVIYEKMNEFSKDLGKTKFLSRKNNTKLIEQRLTKDLRILYIEKDDKVYAIKITNHKHLNKEILKYEKDHYDKLWKS
tara:strand:- start:19 stop:357 length:339 start_codon:yes stop_codon:yes gene_type:complete